MKKIYIGDKITIPNRDEWVEFLQNQGVDLTNIKSVSDVYFLGLSGYDTLITNKFFLKRIAIENFLNCEFIYKERPEEPMNKLKTRDEIVDDVVVTFGYAKATINEIVFYLIKEGILKVSEDEYLELDDYKNCLNYKIEGDFSRDADGVEMELALRKFARLSWFFNKQANGGVHWVPDWDDEEEMKYTMDFNHRPKQMEPCAMYYLQDKPNFFYFKTPEAREKTLAQMTEQELKLLGSGE